MKSEMQVTQTYLSVLMLIPGMGYVADVSLKIRVSNFRVEMNTSGYRLKSAAFTGVLISP